MQTNKFKQFLKILIIIFGAILVSFGNLVFLSVLNINSGGLNGIGIIIRYFISNPDIKILIYDISIAVLSIALWFLGLVFISKEFAIKTLVASIAFPAANFIFTYVPGLNSWIDNLAQIVAGTPIDGAYPVGNMILCGLFGGIFVGSGVAITFVGGGSTGGVDVLSFIMNKHLHIKESIAAFIVDATIILLGIILLPLDQYFIPCLCGIMSSIICSALINFIFNGSQASYQADIISSHWEEISRYAQDVLGRGATIIHVKGGYQNDDRIILRVVFEKYQREAFKDFIAKTDPKAFITITQTNAVYGEGFKTHELSAKAKIEEKIKKKHEK